MRVMAQGSGVADADSEMWKERNGGRVDSWM